MSTVDIDTKLAEILDPICPPTRVRANIIKELKATLKAELLAKMPRRAYPQEINRPNGEPFSVTLGRCDAYNEALSEITKIVNEL